MNSSKFIHISASIKWVSAQRGCVPCLCECAQGVSQQCARMFHGFMRFTSQHYHATHQHAEHVGYATDPHFGIGHFDARLPS
eukprot:8207694-Alexandrium_andersonii.AAC.1